VGWTLRSHTCSRRCFLPPRLNPSEVGRKGKGCRNLIEDTQSHFGSLCLPESRCKGCFDRSGRHIQEIQWTLRWRTCVGYEQEHRLCRLKLFGISVEVVKPYLSHYSCLRSRSFRLRSWCSLRIWWPCQPLTCVSRLLFRKFGEIGQKAF